MKFNRLQLIIVVYLCSLPLSNVHAEKTKHEMANDAINAEAEFPKVEPLNWLNQKFLTKQRVAIEDITRSRFGRGLAGNKNDLRILQRIINENVIAADETELLQALGVVLGDIYVSDKSEFEWKIYTDEIGATHAICVKDTKECLFVITMLSRRMEVGIKPDVSRIYQKGIDAMKHALPKIPYKID